MVVDDFDDGPEFSRVCGLVCGELVYQVVVTLVVVVSLLGCSCRFGDSRARAGLADTGGATCCMVNWADTVDVTMLVCDALEERCPDAKGLTMVGKADSGVPRLVEGCCGVFEGGG